MQVLKTWTIILGALTLAALGVLLGKTWKTLELREAQLAKLGEPAPGYYQRLCTPQEVQSSSETQRQWRQKLELAGASARLALPPIVSELQTMQHEYQVLPATPCIAALREARLEEMEAALAGLQAFLEDLDGTAQHHLTLAAAARRRADRIENQMREAFELKAATGVAALAEPAEEPAPLPQPVATPAPVAAEVAAPSKDEVCRDERAALATVTAERDKYKLGVERCVSQLNQNEAEQHAEAPAIRPAASNSTVSVVFGGLLRAEGKLINAGGKGSATVAISLLLDGKPVATARETVIVPAHGEKYWAHNFAGTGKRGVWSASVTLVQ
jgi:hypothetical protein